MRIYQCDSCNKVISDPHTVKMKEFYLGLILIASAEFQFLLRAREELKYIYAMNATKA